ncbi:MAG: hypothetical protein ABIO67_12935 [Mycobacteriales bacterium]
MSAPVIRVRRRLGTLFLLALLGILVMLGSVLWRIAGTGPLAVYVAVVLVGGVLAIRTAKRRLRALARAEGRTCTCCTTSVHDPVKVV